VDVVDAIFEGVDEGRHRINELMVEVAGVEVDPKAGAIADGGEGGLKMVQMS
jgi:hypothetical protein